MAKEFARTLKKIIDKRADKSDSLVGTVLSVRPIKISCHGGEWELTAEDLQISNHVDLHVGDSVVLAGEDPFSILSVLSDAEPDEYEPPPSVAVDDQLSDTSENPVQNKVIAAVVSALQSVVNAAHAQMEQLAEHLNEIADALGGCVSKSGDTISGDLTIDGKAAVKLPFIEPISAPADDGTGEWRAQGNCVCFYRTAGLLNNQPSQYGYLINITGAGNDVRQIWAAQGDGSLYHRAGNGTGGWSHGGAWLEIADENNIDSLIPDSGWKDVSFAAGYSNIYASVPSRYRRVGKMVQLHLCMKGLEGNWKVVTTLPEGYRPDVSIDVVGRYDSHNRCTFNIASDGTVTFISTDGSVGTGKLCSVNAAYFVE